MRVQGLHTAVGAMRGGAWRGGPWLFVSNKSAHSRCCISWYIAAHLSLSVQLLTSPSPSHSSCSPRSASLLPLFDLRRRQPVSRAARAGPSWPASRCSRSSRTLAGAGASKPHIYSGWLVALASAETHCFMVSRCNAPPPHIPFAESRHDFRVSCSR